MSLVTVLWWYHVPVFLVFLSLGLFVRFYLGTGRTWLLWTAWRKRAHGAL